MKYDGEMLARLVAQAEAAPGQMDMLMIRALIEEASELGAGRALERMGERTPYTVAASSP